MLLHSREEISNWLRTEREIEANITSIQHVKIGGLSLTPELSNENDDSEEDLISDLSFMQFTGFFFSIMDDSDRSLVVAEDLYNSIKQHANVIRMFTPFSEVKGTLEIIDIMGIDAVYSANPIGFELAMSKSAQRDLLGGPHRLFDTDTNLTSERLLLFFDGMIFMSVVDVETPTQNSIHGQVCREFLQDIYSNSSILNQTFSFSPTPTRKEYHIVYVENENNGKYQDINIPIGTYINEVTGEFCYSSPIVKTGTNNLKRFLTS